MREAIRPSVRFKVFERDRFTCRYCGQSAPMVVLEVDHVHPVSAGGSNADGNLVTSCYECNRGKRARLVSADLVPAAAYEQRPEMPSATPPRRRVTREDVDDLAYYWFDRCMYDETPGTNAKIRSALAMFPPEVVQGLMDEVMYELHPQTYAISAQGWLAKKAVRRLLVLAEARYAEGLGIAPQALQVP